MTLNDDLVVCRVVLNEPFQCIQAAEPGRGLVGAEVLDRFWRKLGDAPVDRVTVGQPSRHCL